MKKISLIILFILILGLCSCVKEDSKTINLDGINVVGLRKLALLKQPEQKSKSSKKSEKVINPIRKQALKETALSLGSQSALAWQSDRLNKFSYDNEKYLTRIFNFGKLIINKNVLPPVLIKVKNKINLLSSKQTVKLANVSYQIIEQAHFVTTPPNWRSYLIMNFNYPNMPDETLLPKNKLEQSYWIMYLKKGWKNGIDQANEIYKNNMARLKRDYQGMILYKDLLSQHIISKPYVSETNLGITSNHDKSELNIGDRILHITALPILNNDSKQWQATISLNDKNKTNNTNK